MSVYIDHEENQFRGMVMCHMLADTDEELHAMAAKCGLKRSWFQPCPPSSCSHYDVSKSVRRKAVAFGAVEVDRKQLVAILKSKRDIYTFCEKDVDGKQPTRNITPPAGRKASYPTNQDTHTHNTMSPRFENAITLGLAAFAAAMGITDLDAAPAAATGSTKDKPATGTKPVVKKAPVITPEDLRPLMAKAVDELKLGAKVKAYMAENCGGKRVSQSEPDERPGIKTFLEEIIKEAEDADV